MTDPISEPTAAEERVARHLAARDWLTDEDRWTNSTATFRADYLSAAREVIALVQQPATVPVSSPPADRAALRETVVAALERDSVRCPMCPGTLILHTPSGARAHFTAVHPEQKITGRGSGPWPMLVDLNAEATADAVLPEPADRAAVLHEAADELGRMDYDTDSNDYGYDAYRDAWNGGVMDAAEKLRRMADETPAAKADVDQSEPVADTPCCVNCQHPKRDHDGRADHRQKHSPLVAGEPWCHACHARCDYEAQPAPPKAPPMDPVHILGIGADEAQQGRAEAAALWDELHRRDVETDQPHADESQSAPTPPPA